MDWQLVEQEKNLERPFLDLYLNRSSLHTYLLRHAEALADLRMAQSVRPGKEFPEIAKIEAFNHKVFTLLESKANIKAKHLEAILASSKDVVVRRDKLEMKPTPISKLEYGKLSGVCVAGRIVKIMSEKEASVRVCLVLDNENSLALVSLFNFSSRVDEKISLKRTMIVVVNPHVQPFPSLSKEGSVVKNILVMNQNDCYIDGIELGKYIVQEHLRLKVDKLDG